MDRGETDDARETADLSAPTEAGAATMPVRTVTPASAGESDDSPDDGAATHRRRPGLWFPLIIFVVLLLAGGYVGRFIIPGDPPAPGAAPVGVDPSTAGPSGEGTPGEIPPSLPTPPVRPADALATWAEEVGAAIGVPPVAIQAYGYAQLLMRNSDPACNLSWTTLAGVGEVESFHGQAGGAVLEPSGRSEPVLFGPVLDGREGHPLVRDTDAGAYDGDLSYDRTMGPLHLMPSIWRAHSSDADADGILDPYDIDDASLALARLLCSATDDLGQLNGWRTAVGRYHSGEAYARSVFEAADSYGQRTRNIG